jgi:hypothetical protein
MILIWDNGEEYSSHCIHFIKTDGSILSNEELERALPKGDGDWKKPFVIAWVNDDAIDWRAPDAYEQVYDVITYWHFIKDALNNQLKIDEAVWDANIVGKLMPWWRSKVGYYTRYLDAVEARLKSEIKTNE